MSTSFHVRKYRHDKETYDYLNLRTPTFIDWEVITLFYSVLHLIETYFINHGQPVPTSHFDRENLVEVYLNDIFETYLKFYQLCKNARYDAPITPTELADAYDYYTQIKKFVEPLI